MFPALRDLVRAGLNRAKARRISYINLLSHLVAKPPNHTIALFKLWSAPAILLIKAAWRQRIVHICADINSNRGRLIASIGLLLVPISVLEFLFVAQSYKSIGFAELELKGVAYARAVSSVLADLAGRHPEPGPHLRNFNEARARLDHELATSAASTALISALDASPLNHEGAVDAARFLLTRIGDQSNLLLDPDLASYYVMEVFLRRLPNLIVTSRKVCDELMLARVAGVRSPERTAEILMGVGQLAAGVRALSQSIEAAIAQNSEDLNHGHMAEQASRLTGKLHDLVRGARIDITINELADPSAFDRPPIETLVTDIITEQRSLSDMAANELERLLHARIARFMATLLWSLSISALLAIAAILVAHNVLRSLAAGTQDIVGNENRSDSKQRRNGESLHSNVAMVLLCERAAGS